MVKHFNTRTRHLHNLLLKSPSRWTPYSPISSAKKVTIMPHPLIVFIVRLLFRRFLALTLVLMAAVKNPASLALPPHVLSAPSVRILVKPSSFTLISTAGLASISSNPPLSDILVAPSFTQNLLSTYQLARSGYITVFDENNVYIASMLTL